MNVAFKWVGISGIALAVLILFVWGIIVLGQEAKDGRRTFKCQDTSTSTFTCTQTK